MLEMPECGIYCKVGVIGRDKEFIIVFDNDRSETPYLATPLDFEHEGIFVRIKPENVLKHELSLEF